MATRHYHVTENTPGYLPDSDDLNTFENETEAIAYADQLADELAEHIAELPDNPEGNPGITGKGTGYVLVYDETRMHDLGRVIAVDTCYEDHPEDETDEMGPNHTHPFGEEVCTICHP